MKPKHKPTPAEKPVSAGQAIPQFNPLRWQAAIILALCMALYANTLRFDYTLDDTLMITSNDYTLMGVKGISEILTTDAFAGFLGKDKNLLPGGRYRPLTHVMFAIEYELWGLNPLPGHLLNVLFYALGCLLIFIVLRRFLSGLRNGNAFLSIAFVASLLFAAHPLHTEVVANIKGRDELTTLILLFLSLYLADKWLETKRIAFLVLLFPVFLLALLAKENAFTFIAVIPFTLWFFRRPAPKMLVISFLPLVLAAFAYLGMRINALGLESANVIVTELLNDPFLNTTAAERYATVFYTWFIYLKLLIFPHPLTHDYYPYHIAITNFGNPLVWLSLLVYGFLLVYALKNVIKKSLVAYGILFYAVVFSISSNLLFNIGAFMNERFVFLSLLGFTLIIAWLLAGGKRGGERGVVSRPGIILLVCIVAAYSLKTVTRNTAWKDDFTLFTTDVKVSKNSAKVTVSAGGMLVARAQKEENPQRKTGYLNQATEYLRKGLEIHPKYTAGWILLGNAYFELRDLPPAYDCYENALKLAPANKDASTNMRYLLNVAANRFDYLTAENAARTLLVHFPDSLNFRYELASALLGQQKVDTARLMLDEVLLADPSHFMAWCKMGELYGRYLNRIDESEKYLLKSAEINPRYFPAHENLGIVYAMKGRLPQSRDAFITALAIDEKQARMHRNISLTYSQMGDTLNSGIHLRRAEELEALEKK